MSLPERARGPRPRFFDDPAIDTLMAMFLDLAQEQWVTRARLAALEHWAAHEVTVARSPWSDDYRLPPEAEAQLAEERAAFVRRIMAPIEQV
ncbi:MAG: hypothetical protein ACK4TG_04005 [Thermaurantiacus sp.]